MWARATAGILTALVPSACSLVIPYELGDESGSTRCADGVDNDADGRIDCVDEGCFGDASCEETLASSRLRCRDGVDNDIDGLTDTFDPGCWTSETPSVVRCGSVQGSDFRLDASDHRWAGAALREVVTVSGTSMEALRVESARELRLSELSTGGPAIELTAGFVLPEGASLNIRLEPVRGLYGGARGAVVVAVHSDAETVTLGLAGEDLEGRSTLVDEVVVPRTTGLNGMDEISVRKDEISGRFEAAWNGQRVLAPESPENPPVIFGDAQQVVLRFENVGARAWWLVETTLRRVRHDPCTQPFPLLMGADPPPRETVHAFAGARDRYCAILERDGALVSHTASRDFADTLVLTDTTLRRRFDEFEGPYPFVFENDAGVRVPRPTLAWDPVRAVFRGAGQEDDTGPVQLFESADCRTWRLEGAADLGVVPAIPGAVLGYHVDSPARGGAHHLVLLEGAAIAAATARIYDSVGTEVDGPRSFVPGNTVDFRATQAMRPWTAWVWAAGDSFALGRRASDWLALLSGPTTVLLEPSGEPGTFDRDFIEQGVLWLPPIEDYRGSEWWGVLAFTARGCIGCSPRFGLAYFAPAGFLVLD